MRTTIPVLVFLLCIAGVHLSCNKTAADTNKPPVISSFNASFSNDSVGPNNVVTVKVNYSDPDDAPNAEFFTFTWTAAVIEVESGDPGDLNSLFLVNDEQTCYFRTPFAPGFYELIVEVRDQHDDPVTGSYIFEVDETENDLKINSFTPSFSGSTTDPDEVIQLTVNFSDPEVSGTPDPENYDILWSAVSIEPGVPDPIDRFLIDNDQTCYWRTPVAQGYYELIVEIAGNDKGPVSDGFRFQVSENKSPIITNTSVVPQLPQKNETVTITVTADDPDKNYPLSYTWSSNKGYFTREADNEVDWIWGSTGEATITVKVFDALGASITKQIYINVQQNNDPVIDGYDIDTTRPLTDQSINVSIIAHDPDGDDLSYDWDADGGSFSSINANDAVWIAPSSSGSYSITVTVEDDRGGKSDISIPLEVEDPPE